MGTDDGSTPDNPNIAIAANYIAYVNATLYTKAFLEEFLGAEVAALPVVLEMYPVSPNNYTANLEMLGKLSTDLEFTCGAAALGQALERVSTPLPAYQYVFTYNATYKEPCDLTYPAAYGVPFAFYFAPPLYLFVSRFILYFFLRIISTVRAA